jgi:hypothetical protein
MIKHKLIDKGSVAHALITSVHEPNILIPVKVTIKDIKFDEYNPLYLVKIVKFYDNINFLKKYFIGNSFSNSFGKKPRPFWISNDINTVQKLENHLNKEGERFYVVVDSIHTVRYKNELEDIFSKIQDFLILRNISELKELTTRNLYAGPYKYNTKIEFLASLRNMLISKITDMKISWDEFVKRL